MCGGGGEGGGGVGVGGGGGGGGGCGGGGWKGGDQDLFEAKKKSPPRRLVTHGSPPRKFVLSCLKDVANFDKP